MSANIAQALCFAGTKSALQLECRKLGKLKKAHEHEQRWLRSTWRSSSRCSPWCRVAPCRCRSVHQPFCCRARAAPWRARLLRASWDEFGMVCSSVPAHIQKLKSRGSHGSSSRSTQELLRRQRRRTSSAKSARTSSPKSRQSCLQTPSPTRTVGWPRCSAAALQHASLRAVVMHWEGFANGGAVYRSTRWRPQIPRTAQRCRSFSIPRSARACLPTRRSRARTTWTLRSRRCGTRSSTRSLTPWRRARAWTSARPGSTLIALASPCGRLWA